MPVLTAKPFAQLQKHKGDFRLKGNVQTTFLLIARHRKQSKPRSTDQMLLNVQVTLFVGMSILLLC